MGWLFSYSITNRADMIAHLRRPERYAPGNTLLKSSPVGNNHWYLCRHNESGRVWIGLDLMKGGGVNHGWGYKDIDETCGPNELNCPIGFLDKASPPENEWSTNWREKVRQFHARKKARPEPKMGMVVTIGPDDYKLVAQHENARKGWYVDRVRDGRRFKAPPAMLGRALDQLQQGQA